MDVTMLATTIQFYKKEAYPQYRLFLTRYPLHYNTRKGYRALVRLMQDGYFSTILTSNTDVALEEELDLCELQYKVLVVGRDPDDQIVEALDRGQENSIYIVKLPQPEAQAEQPMVFSSLSDEVQRSLQRYFNRNIIIIGCMDQEDVGVSALASHKDDDICYVRESEPSPDDIVVEYIAKYYEQKSDFIISGSSGEFNRFFSELDTCLKKSASQQPKTPPTQPTTPLQDTPAQPINPSQEILVSKHTTIFISYSHKDDEHLERLLVHLKPLVLDGRINVDTCDSDKLLNTNVWSDKKIKPGANWLKEIKQAMEAATIAILLVSADFFASDFILNVELPALLESNEKGDIVILPVLVGPCNYKHSKLAHIQLVNKTSIPLSRIPSDDNEKVWADVAKHVSELVES